MDMKTALNNVKYSSEGDLLLQLCETLRYEISPGETFDRVSLFHDIFEETNETDFGEQDFFVKDKRGFSVILDHMI